MRFDGAVIREQGVTFAVALVKPAVLNDHRRRDDAISGFTQAFDGLPTVLAAVTPAGRAEYWGREDLSRFLASISIEQIPWRTYTIS